MRICGLNILHAIYIYIYILIYTERPYVISFMQDIVLKIVFFLEEVSKRIL